MHKRNIERLSSMLFALIRPLPSLEGQFRTVVTDITVAGIGIETEQKFEIGQELEISIEIPVTLKGTIVRYETKGPVIKYGVVLSKLGFIDKMLLKFLLRGSLKTTKV